MAIHYVGAVLSLPARFVLISYFLYKKDCCSGGAVVLCCS